jgi:hypothetical protein
MDETDEHRMVGLEPRLADPFGFHFAAVPPGEHAREPIDLREVEAERAADIAHGALRPVGDERRGERRAVAAIFFIDVLHHLLAPLVLEVDVDVGRLVPLPRDEPLEQHAHPRGIDFGDAERVADGRVGRRAAALAEDVLRAGERDDVLDGEEIRLVFQFRDQRELVLDQLADLGRAARRRPIPPRQSLLGELAQIRPGSVPRGHDFLRIFVAQFVERKRAALGDRNGLREQCGRIDRREPCARAQMALAIGVQRVAAFGERPLHPDRGEGVLQRAPGAYVHVDVAGGHLRQAGRVRERSAMREPRAIAGAGEELDGDPRPARKDGGYPARSGERGIIGANRGRSRVCARFRIGRHPKREKAGRERRDIVARQCVASFLRATPPAGDELRQVAVARAVGGEQHELRAVPERHLAADDERKTNALRGDVRADDARERAFVGEGEGRVTQRLRPLDELLRMRRAAQERKVREAMQFGVSGKHLASVTARSARKRPSRPGQVLQATVGATTQARNSR